MCLTLGSLSPSSNLKSTLSLCLFGSESVIVEEKEKPLKQDNSEGRCLQQAAWELISSWWYTEIIFQKVVNLKSMHSQNMKPILH